MVGRKERGFDCHWLSSNVTFTTRSEAVKSSILGRGDPTKYPVLYAKLGCLLKYIVFIHMVQAWMGISTAHLCKTLKNPKPRVYFYFRPKSLKGKNNLGQRELFIHSFIAIHAAFP